ncbi:MAG TPA: hypothetical protein VK852_03675 [Desulfobacterales bacterium]|jgi:hypothetical protein|nr:hypothetical protein [Desulfobacterales bacterium]
MKTPSSLWFMVKLGAGKIGTPVPTELFFVKPNCGLRQTPGRGGENAGSRSAAGLAWN